MRSSLRQIKTRIIGETLMCLGCKVVELGSAERIKHLVSLLKANGKRCLKLLPINTGDIKAPQLPSFSYNSKNALQSEF